MDNMKEKLKNIFKEKKTIGLTVVLILLLIVSLMTYGKNKSNVFKDEYMNNIFIEENDNYNEEQKTNSSKDEIFKEDSSLIINNTNINQQVGNIIVVEIKGEVINPDVYSLNEGSIIKDLIEAAGGLTNEADISNINRAKEINNHELIVIRNINDSVSNENIEINEIQEIEIDDGKININTADLNRLKDIPGIGDVKANSIIMYREENGGFKTIDELKNRISSMDSTAITYYQTNKVIFCNAPTIPWTDLQGVYTQIARRIYFTRNSLVHSKSGKNQERYKPYKDEKQLQKEIPLVKAVAELIIINSSLII